MCFAPLDRGEAFEHVYIFGCFGCCVVNVFAVREFSVESETFHDVYKCLM